MAEKPSSSVDRAFAASAALTINGGGDLPKGFSSTCD
jgi:hypothetical protein